MVIHLKISWKTNPGFSYVCFSPCWFGFQLRRIIPIESQSLSGTKQRRGAEVQPLFPRLQKGLNGSQTVFQLQKINLQRSPPWKDSKTNIPSWTLSLPQMCFKHWSVFEGPRKVDASSCCSVTKINQPKLHRYRMPNLIIHHCRFTQLKLRENQFLHDYLLEQEPCSLVASWWLPFSQSMWFRWTNLFLWSPTRKKTVMLRSFSCIQQNV